VEAAQGAHNFSHGNTYLIWHYIEMIRLLNAQTKQLLTQAKVLLKEQKNSEIAKYVRLLQSIPGIVFPSAVTLVCEIRGFFCVQTAQAAFYILYPRACGETIQRLQRS